MDGLGTGERGEGDTQKGRDVILHGTRLALNFKKQQ